MVKKGDRVRITGRMNDPNPLQVGDTGEVRLVITSAYGLPDQVIVDWDSGRGLILLLPEDRGIFEVTP